ncbi:MAG: integrase core domain-containing protein, partial [bacterium]
MVLAWRLGGSHQRGGSGRDAGEALYQRFGTDWRQAQGIEFLSGNGTEYTSGVFRDFLKARGMESCRTPIRSPQSKSVMEAFFSWFKRNYVNQHPIETLEALQQQVPGWVKHYNEAPSE